MEQRTLEASYREPILRNLVANMRWIHVRPFLANHSLEEVVELWQDVQKEERAKREQPQQPAA